MSWNRAHFSVIPSIYFPLADIPTDVVVKTEPITECESQTNDENESMDQHSLVSISHFSVMIICMKKEIKQFNGSKQIGISFTLFKNPDINTVSTTTNDFLSIERTPTKIGMDSCSKNQIQDHEESTEQIEKSVGIFLLCLSKQPSVKYPNWLFIIIFLE